MTDTSVAVVLSMPFVNLNNADIQFVEKELTLRSYTSTNALSTTKQIELIDKKDFAKVALNEDFKTFVIHVVAMEALLIGMTIYPS